MLLLPKQIKVARIIKKWTNPYFYHLVLDFSGGTCTLVVQRAIDMVVLCCQVECNYQQGHMSACLD